MISVGRHLISQVFPYIVIYKHIYNERKGKEKWGGRRQQQKNRPLTEIRFTINLN